MAGHAFTSPVFWLALAGVVSSWFFYMKAPGIPAAIARTFAPVYRLLENKYYMDWINEHIVAAATRALGRGLGKGGDQALIDGVLIDGSARTVGGIAQLSRRIQTGYLYWYALVMILGVFGLMTWQLWPDLSSLLARLAGR
jgi:NADH-quinone oxidoreductase subunit L